MDTTPEYVEMCQKAEEIQKAWKPAVGDWYCHEDDDGTLWTGPICLVIPIGLDFYARGTWLPRIDQLIEMVDSYIAQARFVAPLADSFATFVVDETNNLSHLRTFEQFWLAYVMVEKYDKIWDSAKKEWVKNG